MSEGEREHHTQKYVQGKKLLEEMLCVLFKTNITFSDFRDSFFKLMIADEQKASKNDSDRNKKSYFWPQANNFSLFF